MTVKTKFKKSTRENLNIGSRPDALTRYMSEISKIKPLTRDEECKLGHQIAEGDITALQKLVQRNLKYVVSIANKYRGCGLSLQDLIEEGNIGIIQAAKRFDPSREVKFITYAVWWIKQAIVDSLAAQARAVRLPVKQTVKMHQGLKISKDLAQSLEGNSKNAFWFRRGSQNIRGNWKKNRSVSRTSPPNRKTSQRKIKKQIKFHDFF